MEIQYLLVNQDLCVYNQQFQVRRSRRAARNHTGLDFVLDCIYKIWGNDADLVGSSGFPEQARSVGHSPTAQRWQQDDSGPYSGTLQKYSDLFHLM